MKIVSLQLFTDISGLFVNNAVSYNMYNRVMFFELESVLEVIQCCTNRLLQINVESELSRKDVRLVGVTAEMNVLVTLGKHFSCQLCAY